MRPVHVAVALIEVGGRYLVCRRRGGSDFARYWEFPGGKRRVGERWTACLRRELREELGVLIRGVRPVGRMSYRYPHRHVTFRIFRCQLAPGARPRAVSASALRWAAPNELLRLRLPPANYALMARHLRLLPGRRRRGTIKGVGRRDTR